MTVVNTNPQRPPMHIGSIIRIVLLFVAAIFFFSLYVAFQLDKKRIPVYQAMIKDSTITTALLDPMYKQTILKKKGVVKSTDYEISYSYKIGDATYHEKKTVKEEPQTVTMPLYYSKSDPAVHTFNPQADIDNIEKDAASKGPIVVGCILVAVAAWYIRKYLKRRAEDIEEMETGYRPLRYE
ncbi:hypothetical protein [Chitinophaga sp. Cy-1792]|uniref:hypothetical protein n=1 Tax=Chitinophaga sp. Cy-1792 TaxID=2608339 RepID=UPI001420307B|nr:hypothetical protein [Chitinophaga sp. Cy-1792]NIG53499.1 hypothetical protein [Chitinophaga sp. Cy-1792]